MRWRVGIVSPLACQFMGHKGMVRADSIKSAGPSCAASEGATPGSRWCERCFRTEVRHSRRPGDIPRGTSTRRRAPIGAKRRALHPRCTGEWAGVTTRTRHSNGAHDDHASSRSVGARDGKEQQPSWLARTPAGRPWFARWPPADPRVLARSRVEMADLATRSPSAYHAVETIGVEKPSGASRLHAWRAQGDRRSAQWEDWGARLPW